MHPRTDARTDARASAQPPAPDDPRLLDGRYLVGPRIARGGMASVHEALDTRLDRTVAVKIMHAGLADSAADVADRFVREARSAARLSHPHIVSVYDQGDDDGAVFLVMELVRGHTLRDVISAESPMRPARALALLEPVLSALAAAHRAGIVHRDVKPENVLISDDPADSGPGRVKVADFGLARAVTADTRHTATQGVLIGTVSYLAPELVTDGRADARADVYAAGVVLCEMLTGVKPHQGETPIQVAYRHVHHDVPPPSALVPGLPAYVDALVARATARDRAQRPADAGVLLHQAHRVLQALRDGVRDDPELTVDLALHTAASDAPDRPDDVRALFDDSATAPDPADRLRRLDEPAVRPPVAEVRTVREQVAHRTTALPVREPGPTPVPPPDARRRPRRPDEPPRTRVRTGRLLLLVALVIALAVGAGAFWFGSARYTETPSVLGQQRDAAVAALEDADLDVAFADPVYDTDRPAGVVVAADPSGGSQVLPGDTVTLTLSLGDLRVPTVRNLDEDAAQDALLERQLDFGKSIGRFSETKPEGTVLASKPPAGTELDPGDTVDLVVSRGREPIPVGSWVGDDVDSVRTALEQRGLELDVTEERFDDGLPEGAVISQQPTRGTLYRGDTVTVVVSKGPELVEVPSVRLSGVEVAEQTLRDAGFDVDVEQDDVYYGLGFAVRTDPEAGSMAPRGSTITVYVV
ncbi:Stk1 family PASTA domain-containing Ser/Thr kinase [Nocardioides marinquilinus]|uniref:non-specific serine/threonine protein kinase n=1 Tax=Nocardioides marinquilinus TaxID=1210400 RepID=A0ABP9PSG3_9ACTN